MTTRPRHVVCSMLMALTVASSPSSAGGAAPPSPTPGLAKWACGPRATENVCAQPYDVTVLSSTQLEPRRVARVEHVAVPDDPPVDCFYVYPTVITVALGPNAERRLSGEVRGIIRSQAAAFTPRCRVFAPLYRQVTSATMAAELLTGQRGPTGPQQLAYADVLGAWREYLQRENHGRGFVLIGHSQGSAMLSMLLANEIDPIPALRDRLVGAFLPGAAVTTLVGRTTGGTARHIPVCTTLGQDGCIVAYSAYGQRPDAQALFGTIGALSRAFGGPMGKQYQLACTNPAELAGDGTRLKSMLAGRAPGGLAGMPERQFWNGHRPEAPTPWVTAADRYDGTCERGATTASLRIRSGRGTLVPSAVPWAAWGLHQGEFALTLGSMLEIVREQTATYLSTRGDAATPGW